MVASLTQARPEARYDFVLVLIAGPASAKRAKPSAASRVAKKPPPGAAEAAAKGEPLPEPIVKDEPVPAANKAPGIVCWCACVCLCVCITSLSSQLTGGVTQFTGCRILLVGLGAQQYRINEELIRRRGGEVGTQLDASTTHVIAMCGHTIKVGILWKCFCLIFAERAPAACMISEPSRCARLDEKEPYPGCAGARQQRSHRSLPGHDTRV